ncbi:MAG: integrase family protein [Sphingopyxis sp.]|nr:integrase family protein [Sphingopyxis sp.]
MATGRISKETVDRLQAGSTASFLWDDELKGFGVRVTTSGAKSYIFQYRMGGREAKTQRYTIGRHGSPWTAATARMEAVRICTLVRQRRNPVDLEKQRRREAAELPFAAYATRFAQLCAGKGWQTLVERSLRLHLIPALGNKALPQIVRSDIVIAMDEIPKEQIANRRNVFAVARRLFRWAVSRGDIQISPMEGMETPKAVKPRDRWLSDSELPRIWNATRQTHPCFGPIVRLLIATGQRREEVSGLTWAELDRKARMWTLPGERTKNGEPNYIPLNDLAVAEFDKIAGGESWPKRGRTFATSSGAAFSGFAKGKLKLDSLIECDGGNPITSWRLHDLRRTVATGFQRLGVRFEVTEAILNHVGASRAGVAGIYQRHDWKPEKIEALRMWNDHLEAIFSD